MSNTIVTLQQHDGLTLKTMQLGERQLTMPCFLPVINSVATTHLTPAELTNINLGGGCFDLPSLYLKPGIPCLSHFYHNNIDFYQWPGITLLNAKNDRLAQFKINSNTFKIHSQYDGCDIKFNADDVLQLATLFKVDACILPGFLGDKQHSTKLFELNRRNLLPIVSAYQGSIPLFVEYDLEQRQAVCEHPAISGYVYASNHYSSLSLSSKAHPALIHLIMGDFNWQDILHAVAFGADCIQSDKPASDGAAGVLYTKSGSIDITTPQCELQFRAIDDGCECYCCRHFTIAYLHHLFKNNVLLGTKLQVLHNLHFVSSMITALHKFAVTGRLHEFKNKYMMSRLG